MRTLRTAVVAVLVLMLTGFAAPAAYADSNVRIVRLSLVDGDTQIDRRDGNGFQTAFLNLPVVEGQRLWARDDEARAEVEFEDGSTMRLIPQSLAEFSALGRRSNGDLVTEVDLQEGVAYFNIRRHGGDEFTVSAGRTQIVLPAGGHFRVNVEQDKIEVAVFEGSLEVRGEGYSLDVRKSETLTLDLTDPGRYFLARGVNADSWDDWDHDREQARADAAAAAAEAQAAYASANTYYAPVNYGYSYGYNDLSMYGSYIYVAGYGQIWRPAYYGVTWNPWMDGAWVWYPGFGYVWVSAYPWGWLPYRYGTWVFVPAYGWCWNPGGHRWQQWVSHPVAVNPPHSFQPPHVPSGGGGRGNPGGGGGVVIVGRGPITGRGPARVYTNDGGGIGRENDPRFARHDAGPPSRGGQGGNAFIGGRDGGRSSGGATSGSPHGRPQWTGGGSTGNNNPGQPSTGGGSIGGRGGSTGRGSAPSQPTGPVTQPGPRVTPPPPPSDGGQLGRGRSVRGQLPDDRGSGASRGDSSPPDNRGGSMGNRGGSSAGGSGSSGGSSPHTAPPPSPPPSRSTGTSGGSGSSVGGGRSAPPPPQPSKPDKQQFRSR